LLTLRKREGSSPNQLGDRAIEANCAYVLAIKRHASAASGGRLCLAFCLDKPPGFFQDSFIPRENETQQSATGKTERIRFMKTKIEKSIRSLLLPLVLVCFGLLPGVQATDLDSVLPNGNTADGSGVLVGLTSGVWNTALGFEALNNDTAGGKNTATGLRALFSDTTGSFNTATGVYALYGNTTGWYNSAIGANALSNNITGNYNTAAGYAALNHNHGDGNTASGFGALFLNTTGSFNAANGYKAINRNTAGSNNTANGSFALESNTTGSFNTANGYQALKANTGGGANTAIGVGALIFNTTGSGNTALGFEAGGGVTTANNVIVIGATAGGANVSNSCFIGNIRDVTTANADAIPVMIDSAGQLGTASSSRRFKNEIKPMDQSSQAILGLRPATFQYKSDSTGTPQFGLIAEEVAQVNPDLVVRDEKGEIYTVRYDAVNAMLLNEFLKEHRTVQELRSTVAKQEARIAQQQKGMEAFTARLDEQQTQIQKVSNQLEVRKPAPQMVVNHQ